MEVILLGLLGYLAVILRDIPTRLFNVLKTNITSSISITSENKEQYNKMNEYLFSLNKKCLKNNVENSEKWEEGKTKERVSINYGTYIFKIDKGAWCVLNKTLKDQTFYISSIMNLTIIGNRKDKVLNNIKDTLNGKNSNAIRSYCSSNINDHGRLLPKRDINQVFFKEKNDLIHRINKWSKQKEEYLRRGVVYKLGILLYGEHGCGKSSIAKAVASYLHYDIYYVNLKGFENYRDLVEKLIHIPEKSVVLLEDVDCIIGNREDKKDKNKDEILNTALNFLDGALSPNECVIIATTNYIDRLDEAFTRAGRFDVKLNIGRLNYEEAKEMCLSYNVNIDDLKLQLPVNPSDLQNILIQKL